MPTLMNFRGFTASDALDSLPQPMRYGLHMAITAVFGLLFFFIEGGALLDIVRYQSPWVIPLGTVFFGVVIAPLIVVLRKSSSLLIYLLVLLPTVLFDLYLEANVRAQGEVALWTYTSGTFIAAVPVPLRFVWAWSFDAIIMGIVPLWVSRLLAPVVYRNDLAAPHPSREQQEALFPAAWTREDVNKPERDPGYWILRLLGLGYLTYLLVLVMGVLGTSPWPAQVSGLMAMTYANPALAMNTYGKVGIMVLLAFIGAYNVTVRWHSTLALAVGHTISTVGSLGFYVVDGPTAAYRDFLLSSAIVDGVMVILFVWILIRYHAESRHFARQKAFPVFYSVPARISRWTLYLVAAFSWALVLIALAFRVFSDGSTGLGAVYGYPDPILTNTLTAYGTIGLLAFLLAERESLRKYLFGVMLLPLTVGTLAGLLWFICIDPVLIKTRGGASVAVDWYFAVYLSVNVLAVGLLLALRKMFYNVEYLITSINPSSANNAMGVYNAFFGGDAETQGIALQNIDRFVGDVRGRKRGLINFPFWILENVLSPLFGLHPSFSTMHHDERRYFLRKYLLRLPTERQRAFVPFIADVAYAVGVALHSIVTFADLSQAKNAAAMGYVPPDARDRLQSEYPPEPPPYRAVAPLPKRYDDPANHRPDKPQAPRPLLAPRVVTPVSEPDVPDEVDYLIVGSGAGGAVMAYRLASAPGIDASRILLVERGARYSPLQDFNDNEMQMITKLYKEGGLQQTKNFNMIVLQGECVGGTTVVNNAVCFEMQADAREEWQNQFDIKVHELDAEYQRVGQELAIGQLDEKAINRHVRRRFEEGVERYNASVDPEQKLLMDGPLKVNACNVVGDGLWNLGNKRLHKRSMLETYIPWAEGHGAKVLSNTAAVRFMTSDGRRADAVLLRSATGDMKRVAVRKAVVIAGGVIASSHFLLRSGLRGNVGKRMSCNFALPVALRYADIIDAFDGTQITLGAMDPQHRAVFETYFNPPSAFALSIPFFFNHKDDVIKDYRHYLNFGALVGSETNGEIQLKADIVNGRAFTWRLGERDRERICYALATLVKIGRLSGATDAILPLRPGVHLQLTATHIDRFINGLADYPLRMSDVLINTAHPQGGNRMTGDNSPLKHTRVVNGDFLVQGYENVYVADASVFPTSIGVNPQWTIMALSALAAQKVLANR